MAVIGDKTMRFEVQEILAHSFTMLLPTSFTELTAEKAELKYPSVHRPQFIISDSDNCTNFTFSLLDIPMNESHISEMTQKVKTIIQKLNPANLFYNQKILVTDAAHIGVVDYKSPALDGDLYNLVFIFCAKGKGVLNTFNCDFDAKDSWESVVYQLINTIIPAISLE